MKIYSVQCSTHVKNLSVTMGLTYSSTWQIPWFHNVSVPSQVMLSHLLWMPLSKSSPANHIGSWVNNCSEGNQSTRKKCLKSGWDWLKHGQLAKIAGVWQLPDTPSSSAQVTHPTTPILTNKWEPVLSFGKAIPPCFLIF